MFRKKTLPERLINQLVREQIEAGELSNQTVDRTIDQLLADFTYFTSNTPPQKPNYYNSFISSNDHTKVEKGDPLTAVKHYIAYEFKQDMLALKNGTYHTIQELLENISTVITEANKKSEYARSYPAKHAIDHVDYETGDIHRATPIKHTQKGDLDSNLTFLSKKIADAEKRSPFLLQKARIQHEASPSDELPPSPRPGSPR